MSRPLSLIHDPILLDYPGQLPQVHGSSATEKRAVVQVLV